MPIDQSTSRESFHIRCLYWIWGPVLGPPLIIKFTSFSVMELRLLCLLHFGLEMQQLGKFFLSFFSSLAFCIKQQRQSKHAHRHGKRVAKKEVIVLKPQLGHKSAHARLRLGTCKRVRKVSLQTCCAEGPACLSAAVASHPTCTHMGEAQSACILNMGIHGSIWRISNIPSSYYPATFNLLAGGKRLTTLGDVIFFRCKWGGQHGDRRAVG